MTRALLVFAALSFSTACDSGLSSDFLGVYTISEWTENTAGCDAEGPSILTMQTETSFYVKVSEFFGVEFITANTCADVTACAAEAGEDTINLSGFAFENGNDDSGWTGNGYSIGGSTTCSGDVWEWVMTSAGPDSVQLTTRTTLVTDIPLDSEGFCDGDAAEAAAANQPCDELEVVTGTFVQDI